MLFGSYEKMFAFYKAYGKEEEFSVKKLASNNMSHGIVKYATFTCGRNNKLESNSTNVLK